MCDSRLVLFPAVTVEVVLLLLSVRRNEYGPGPPLAGNEVMVVEVSTPSIVRFLLLLLPLLDMEDTESDVVMVGYGGMP